MIERAYTNNSVDNSEWMRNGDYNPSRMEAQHDAINLICGAKTQQHPENTIGILTMGGKSPRVQVALTTGLGKLLSVLSSLKIDGESINFSQALRVAQLALKRRSDGTQGTVVRKIIAFVGSPLQESIEELVKLGKRLKKNNIVVDIVNFGEELVNTKKLEAFIDAVNGDEKKSNLVTVPPGPHVLSDILLTSPIVQAEGGTGPTSAEQFEFGVDPSVDPELAMALRMSLEEERRRQERLKKEAEMKEGKSEEKKEEKEEEKREEPGLLEDIEMDEEEQLRLALELSKQEYEASKKEKQEKKEEEPKKEDEIMHDETYDEDLYGDEMDEEEQLRMALELSKQEQTAPKKEENIQDIIGDEGFMKDVMESLGGEKKEEEKKDEKEEKK